MARKIKNIDSVGHIWAGQEIATGSFYTLLSNEEAYRFASDQDFIIALATNLAEVYANDILISTISEALSVLTGNIVELDAPKSAMQRLLVETTVSTGPVGSRSISLVTPDFSDRTCWYQKSVKVEDEILSPTGDGITTTFSSSHPHWINIYHDKLTYTHKQIPKRDGTFGKHADWDYTVKINDVAQSKSTYSVNFVAGTITFTNQPAEGAVIKATYWHNDGVSNPSEWLIVPAAGKKYIVEHAELQFSEGVTVNDTIRFEIWAGSTLATYGSFSDQLFEAGYGQMRADYRNANDFINAANLGQGSIPKIGALTKNVVVLPFNYIQAFTLDSSLGVVFRIVLVNNSPYTNTEIATGTFYLQII